MAEGDEAERCRYLGRLLIALGFVVVPAWIALAIGVFILGIINSDSPDTIPAFVAYFLNDEIPSLIFLAVPFVAMVLGWMGSGSQSANLMVWSVSILVLWLCVPLIFFVLTI